MVYGPWLGLRPYRWIAGISLGLAAGVKWSGLYALAAFGLMTVLWDVMARKRAGVSRPWSAGLVLRDGPFAFVAVCGAALVAYTERDGVKFFDLIGATLIPMNYLVPILGILAVTSEWSQRTGLITFTLEPRRGRVVLAKLAATLLTAVTATIVALAVAAGLTLLVGSLGSGDADWHMKGTAYATLFAYMLLQAGMGVAFGLLIQNTPGAICAFLFIPIVVSLFNLAGEWGQKAAEWVNPQQSMAPLIDGSVSGDQWGKLAVTLALWLVLPMVLGFVRLTKREVKSA